MGWIRVDEHYASEPKTGRRSATTDWNPDDVEGCDLSQMEVALVRRTTFVDTKLVGTDFSGATLTDVVFENCILRLTSFRMATLSRVRFDGCTIDDVDCYDATLTDVDVTASRLTDLASTCGVPRRSGSRGCGTSPGFSSTSHSSSVLRRCWPRPSAWTSNGASRVPRASTRG